MVSYLTDDASLCMSYDNNMDDDVHFPQSVVQGKPVDLNQSWPDSHSILNVKKMLLTKKSYDMTVPGHRK